MNVEQARFNMVEQQIRTWEVLDQEILDLLYVVRREKFVPAAYRALAFSDLEIPLGAPIVTVLRWVTDQTGTLIYQSEGQFRSDFVQAYRRLR